jgi:RNA polymerase sigma-70 factor, ECF subfamily
MSDPRVSGSIAGGRVGHFLVEEPLLSMTETTLQHGPDIRSTVRLAADGDEVACARLVTDHYPRMMRAAFVIVGDSDTAREAVQLAWSIAWRRLGSVRDPERVGPWLVSIAANEARHLAKRQRRRTIVEISAGPDDRNSGDPGDGIGLLDLGRALRGLKPDERSLLAMRYVAGLDSNQIGQQTGMSASGVRSRLARLLDRLREDLGDA